MRGAPTPPPPPPTLKQLQRRAISDAVLARIRAEDEARIFNEAVMLVHRRLSDPKKALRLEDLLNVRVRCGVPTEAVIRAVELLGAAVGPDGFLRLPRGDT